MTSSISALVPVTYYQSTSLPELFFAVVYWYKNVNVASACDFGKYYVGGTRNEKHRRGCWNSYPSAYAGAKIDAARKRTPQKKWEYDRFCLWSTSLEHLKAILSIYETHFIDFYDSFKNGFNSNRGGAGRPGTTTIRVTAPDGSVTIYFSYNEVGRAFNLTSGGVQYYLDKKADSTNKDGYKFERLTN